VAILREFGPKLISNQITKLIHRNDFVEPTCVIKRGHFCRVILRAFVVQFTDLEFIEMKEMSYLKCLENTTGEKKLTNTVKKMLTP
jgi:hypothetical protein